MTAPQYIVLYDEGTLTAPMAWCDECPGALTGWWPGKTIAAFQSRKDAHQAIRISNRYARLCEAQGKAVNEDFTTGAKNLKIAKTSTT